MDIINVDDFVIPDDDVPALRAAGVADEFALYLLPNAVAVRFTESASLIDLRHKHAMRLCYNAQEEIWKASRDEAEQVLASDITYEELGLDFLAWPRIEPVGVAYLWPATG